MKDFLTDTVFILSILFTIVGLLYFFFSLGFSPDSFKNSCENYEGYFYEIQNVTCNIYHPNCAFNCNLNGKNYNYEDLDVINYNKYFCIEDCAYENDKNKEVRCVC